MLDIESAVTAIKSAADASGRAVFKRALKMLKSTSSAFPEVNVGKLDLVSQEDSIVLVPGKVLGDGTVAKKLHVGALSFTPAAAKKITKAGGEALSLKAFVQKYGNGKGVLLIGG